MQYNKEITGNYITFTFYSITDCSHTRVCANIW